MQRLLGSMVVVGSLVSTLCFTAYVNELPDYSDICSLCTSVQATEQFCVWGGLQKLHWERVYAFVILFLMVAYSFALIVGRWLKYAVASKQSRAFLSAVATALQQDHFEEAINIAALYPESPVAVVVDASFQRDRTGCATDAYGLRPSMQSRQRAIVFVTERMKRSLWTLEALGWSVPLVSLSLSLSGVILCLKAMRAADGTGISAIAGGLAEALWPTALAMLATIPIVWSHKFFSWKLGAFLLEMDRLSLAIVEEIVDRSRFFEPSTSPVYITQELDSRPTVKLAIDNRPTFRHHTAS